jgi:hypothetical protein
MCRQTSFAAKQWQAAADEMPGGARDIIQPCRAIDAAEC